EGRQAARSFATIALRSVRSLLEENRAASSYASTPQMYVDMEERHERGVTLILCRLSPNRRPQAEPSRGPSTITQHWCADGPEQVDPADSAPDSAGGADQFYGDSGGRDGYGQGVGRAALA